MSARAWTGLSAILLAWALFATWKWQSVSRVSVSSSPLLANEAVADLERVVFLRQFADQYLNYDENSYWRNQTAIAFLMSPPLRENRLQELNLQRERRKTVSFRQTSKLVSVRKKSNNEYVLGGSLEGRESDRSWKLGYEIALKLGDVPKTPENIWGLEVAEMTLKTGERPAAGTIALSLSEKLPALVSFPCLVENVETPAGLPVRVKITSLRTSEIQFLREGAIDGTKSVTALCRDQKFPVSLASASGDADLFLDVASSRGLARAEKPKLVKKKREAYQKNLEQELGFVIEE